MPIFGIRKPKEENKKKPVENETAITPYKQLKDSPERVNIDNNTSVRVLLAEIALSSIALACCKNDFWSRQIDTLLRKTKQWRAVIYLRVRGYKPAVMPPLLTTWQGESSLDDPNILACYYTYLLLWKQYKAGCQRYNKSLKELEQHMSDNVNARAEELTNIRQNKNLLDLAKQDYETTYNDYVRRFRLLDTHTVNVEEDINREQEQSVEEERAFPGEGHKLE